MKTQLPLALSTVLVLAAAGCSKTDDVQDLASATETEDQAETAMATSPNDQRQQSVFQRKPALHVLPAVRCD